MLKNKEQFRQGDVLVTRVGKIPKAAKPKARDTGRVVLAYGEVTGHAHAIAQETATLFSLLNDSGEDLYLRADGTVALSHEEHKTHCWECDRPSVAYFRSGDFMTYFCREHARGDSVPLIEPGATEFPDGNYRITRQREYSPKAIRNVAD